MCSTIKVPQQTLCAGCRKVIHYEDTYEDRDPSKPGTALGGKLEEGHLKYVCRLCGRIFCEACYAPVREQSPKVLICPHCLKRVMSPEQIVRMMHNRINTMLSNPVLSKQDRLWWHGNQPDGKMRLPTHFSHMSLYEWRRLIEQCLTLVTQEDWTKKRMDKGT